MSAFQLFEKLKQSMGTEAAEAIANAFDEFSAEIRRTVTREDFQELREIVADLALAQKRTEQRLDSLALKVEELAEAQKRTEQRLDSLALKVEELAEAQTRTEKTMLAGFADIHRRFGVIGSRWGDGAEEAFREGLLAHVRELGYSVEHFQGQDPDGYINGEPRSYDLDVLTRNGMTIASEIKADASGADVTEFNRSVTLYERQSGRQVQQRILVAVTIQRAALRRAADTGVVVATGFESLGQPSYTRRHK